MFNSQIELEEELVKLSSSKFRQEFEKALQNKTFGSTKTGIAISSNYIENFSKAIDKYTKDYSKGIAVRDTIAASILKKFDNSEIPAIVCMKVVLNSIHEDKTIQAMYRRVGEGIEDEFKMEEYKDENSHYYKSILNSQLKRGAKARWIKNSVKHCFEKKLDFHSETWDITSKIHVGMILINLMVEATGLIQIEDYYIKGKHIKRIVPSEKLLAHIEDLNAKFEVLSPILLPMIEKPKPWTGTYEGGYHSPFIKRNKLIKNDSKSYITMLKSIKMPKVYSAINTVQSTAWQINLEILNVVEALWEEGTEIAGLPCRENEEAPPFPLPELAKDDALTEEQIEIKTVWKREKFEIHNRNRKKSSQRILVSQILRIAKQFQEYKQIYFPYQMDFRGRVYPIPVLLQPQGSDLAKGLLQFANGKPIKGDSNAIKWFKVHGANVFGYDKVSFEDRIKWVEAHEEDICLFAKKPLENRGWVSADKPIQFLAWCKEYAHFKDNADTFITKIPVQLDATASGLQQYSALLKDEVGGKAVNLIDSEVPSDIYRIVAEELKNRLSKLKDTDNFAKKWLEFGFDRKLTKRPVMVLPYGGSEYSCREFISDYLLNNYSSEYLWKFFQVGNNPSDCVFKASLWLSKQLWGAIKDTVKCAITGMDYIKKVVSVVSVNGDYLEWKTPIGLIVRQKYQVQTKKVIRTELYGSVIRTTVNLDSGKLDKKRQASAACPNIIHSLDASCLMLYLNKCKDEGIENFMVIHDSYGTLAPDTEKSAKLLRESFVEIYSKPVLETIISNITKNLSKDEVAYLPTPPMMGKLLIEDVCNSSYFFN